MDLLVLEITFTEQISLMTSSALLVAFIHSSLNTMTFANPSFVLLLTIMFHVYKMLQMLPIFRISICYFLINHAVKK